ncbi:MAG: zinc ribbon domain-containing protein [Candidatus Thorarchaeota archaeon]
MKIVAILTILTIIPWAGNVLSFVALILLFQCLTDITNANLKLNSAILENYRSKYSTTLILRLIGAILNVAGWFFPLNFNIFAFTFNPISLTISGVGWILSIIAGAIEMGAWQSFTDFAEQSTNVFPANLKVDVIEGSKNLKTAALMYILSFLIITILLGWIFQIIGFFKLAKLEQIVFSEPQVSTAPISEPKVSPVSAESKAKTNFCPNCGAQIKGEGKFCGECGSPLT